MSPDPLRDLPVHAYELRGGIMPVQLVRCTAPGNAVWWEIRMACWRFSTDRQWVPMHLEPAETRYESAEAAAQHWQDTVVAFGAWGFRP